MMSGILNGDDAGGKKSSKKKSVKPKRFRKYGKLKPSDFRGQPPQTKSILSKLDAYSMTVMRYEMDYKYTVRNSRWTIRLRALRIFATFDRMKSWNQKPFDDELLDHEQGHFDITQVAALAAQREIAEKLKKRRVSGQGRSKTQAMKRLRTKIDVLLQRNVAQLPNLHRDYDRVTRSGLDTKQQTAQRRNQKQQLKDLKAVRKKR